MTQPKELPLWIRAACLCVYCVAVAVAMPFLWTLMIGVQIYKGIRITIKWLQEGK